MPHGNVARNRPGSSVSVRRCRELRCHGNVKSRKLYPTKLGFILGGRRVEKIRNGTKWRKKNIWKWIGAKNCEMLAHIGPQLLNNLKSYRPVLLDCSAVWSPIMSRGMVAQLAEGPFKRSQVSVQLYWREFKSRSGFEEVGKIKILAAQSAELGNKRAVWESEEEEEENRVLYHCIEKTIHRIF